MSDWLRDNPLFTLKRKLLLKSKYTCKWSKFTKLKGKSYIVKKIISEHTFRDSLSKRIKSVRYRQSKLKSTYIDETKYNLHLRRSQVRFKKETKCCMKEASSTHSNMNISQTGQVWEKQREAFTKDKCRESLGKLLKSI